MRSLIAGNWKMHGLGSSLGEIEAVCVALAATLAHADVLICPPASLLSRAHEVAGNIVALGGQDCHAEMIGAYTGDISAEMLKDAGASAVIVGHSERRQYHRETDADVAAKARAAWRVGLTAVICMGETEAQRTQGEALNVISEQLQNSVPDGATHQNTVIAYEPVWAIGTGKTATSADIVEMHGHVRGRLLERFGDAASEMRILYGGSVKPANAAEILGLDNVNGALVGGASLKSADLMAIIHAVGKP